MNSESKSKQRLNSLINTVPTSLKICSFNARSIVNKTVFLFNLLLTGNYDLVFIVETWMSPTIRDSLVCPSGYDLVRKDRTHKRGGGILVLYKSCYTIIERPDDNNNAVIEHICIDLLVESTNNRLRFMCVYCPPDLTRQTTYINRLSDCISTCKRNSEYFYLLGDFNMPFINWMSLVSINKVGETFLDFCIETGLHQYVLEATSTSGSILDLLLCNEFAFRKVSSICIRPPLSTTCDHNLIEIQLELENTRDTSSSVPIIYRYNAGNYDLMRQTLSAINWTEIFVYCNFDVQQIYNHFLMIIHSLIRQHIPTTKFKSKVRQPKHITNLAKKKNKLYQKLKTDISFKDEYKAISKIYDKAVSGWYDKTEQRVCQSGNTRNFYKCANKKMKSFPAIPPLLSASGNLVTDDKEKADLFNETFYETFITDNQEPLNLGRHSAPENDLLNLHIDNNAIEEALSKLSAKTSNTPDGVPSYVLKQVGLAISPFLIMFYNLSLQSGKIPSQWKTAQITPCYKKGNKNSPENYRPISQTSAICRLLEKIICAIIIDYLSKNNLLSQEQHGFLPCRSTSSQLLMALNDWQEWFHSGETTNVIYTDLAKAFDKVSHPKLLEVLVSYGINGSLFQWIKSFLTGRSQIVTIKQSLSEPVEVKSGVPQGSVLGPLLFILFIDDLASVTSPSTKISLFADDAKVYATDQSTLQNDLNSICDFLQKRQLQLAPDKCEHLTICKSTTNHQFFMDNTQVRCSTSVKDLGIMISANLTWVEQVNNINLKAFRICQHILRSFNSNNLWTLLKAYTVYVRPILEYSSVVWNPHNSIGLIRSLESVQRYYTRRICCRCNIPFRSYDDRLYKLNIKSLQYRRIEADLIMVYKIIHQLVDIPLNDFFDLYTSPYSTRRHRYCLDTKRCHSQQQKGFFAFRVVKVWNSLPADIVHEESLTAFRSKLRKFDLSTIVELVRF